MARPRDGFRRTTVAGLLALSLVGGAIGGGVAGATATAVWLAQNDARVTPTASAPPASLQPISNAPPASAMAQSPGSTAAATNVAGAVYRAVNPSVVQVVVSGTTSGQMSAGAGTGFVVDARGYVLTNQHVVEGARAVSLRFSNGESRSAQVVGTDRGNDLALLRVELPEGVPVAPMGDSSTLEVGETAIAIGSPFGLDQTVTQGIISAVNRTWAPGDGRVRRGLIQTDTPINPGNSGGPLLNARGEVIGVTSMIESPVRGNVGVGFAVPINTARQLLPQLEAGAHLEPAWLGIAGLALDAAVAQDQGLSVEEGVLITNVVPGSPADMAGLRGGQSAGQRIARGGDVIVALDGTAVIDMEDLAGRVGARQPGDTITLTIVRGSQRQDVRVSLGDWPTQMP